MKIKVKVLNPLCKPTITDKGDWIDLQIAENVELVGPRTLTSRKQEGRKVIFTDVLLHLGVAIELPPGYEAVINPRSSMFKKYGILLTNGQGVIDNSYNGDGDEWLAHVIPTRDALLIQGSRLFQFRVQLSQKATVWQKIKHLFTSKMKLVYVDHLGNKNRGGFGSTGV